MWTVCKTKTVHKTHSNERCYLNYEMTATAETDRKMKKLQTESFNSITSPSVSHSLSLALCENKVFNVLVQKQYQRNFPNFHIENHKFTLMNAIRIEYNGIPVNKTIYSAEWEFKQAVRCEKIPIWLGWLVWIVCEKEKMYFFLIGLGKNAIIYWLNYCSSDWNASICNWKISKSIIFNWNCFNKSTSNMSIHFHFIIKMQRIEMVDSVVAVIITEKQRQLCVWAEHDVLHAINSRHGQPLLPAASTKPAIPKLCKNV